MAGRDGRGRCGFGVGSSLDAGQEGSWLTNPGIRWQGAWPQQRRSLSDASAVWRDRADPQGVCVFCS